MRSVCRSEPRPLAVFTSLDARRLSVRTKIPGDIYESKCGVFVSQNQIPQQFPPVRIRGAFRSEPKSLATFTSLNARSFSAGIKIPRNSSQCVCEVFVGQNRNSWRYFPAQIRGAFSVRTESPGGISQCDCEAFFGLDRNSWQCLRV